MIIQSSRYILKETIYLISVVTSLSDNEKLLSYFGFLPLSMVLPFFFLYLLTFVELSFMFLTSNIVSKQSATTQTGFAQALAECSRITSFSNAFQYLLFH